MNLAIVMEIAKTVHGLSQNSGDNCLVTEPMYTCLHFEHLQDVCAGTSVDNLHNNPEIVATDERNVFADDVPMT